MIDRKATIKKINDEKNRVLEECSSEDEGAFMYCDELHGLLLSLESQDENMIKETAQSLCLEKFLVYEADK